MGRNPTTRLLLSLLLLIVLVVAGVAGLAHLKFKSVLSDSVHERLQIVAATSARDFATATDLGLSIPEVANGIEILERAGGHDPLIRSITVFEPSGSVIHSIGPSSSQIAASTRDAYRLAGEGITDGKWSIEGHGSISSGTIIAGPFGQPLGGVAVEYPTSEMRAQANTMGRTLLGDATLVAVGLSVLLILLFVLFRSRLSGTSAEHPTRLPVVLMSVVLLIGVTAFGALTLRNFSSSLEPELERRASLVGATISDDADRALAYDIPVREFVGVEEYFGLFLEEFPEISYLALRDEDGRVVAVTTDADLQARGEDTGDRGLSPVEISAADSVIYVFSIGDGSTSTGSVEIGVDRDYVQSKVSDLGLDVGVILIAAMVLALEVVLAISSRFPHSQIRAKRRRRHPGDARIALLVFAVAEELNKSFLPLFTEAADNPTGLDANVVISLPIIAFLLAMAIASPVAGRIVSKLGQRRLFLAGLMAAALSHLGMAFAGNVLQIIGLRALTGVGYAMATIASMEYLLERLSPGNRARGIGAFVTVIMGGTFVGTALGGILADRLGFDAVFLISFGLVIFAGLLAVGLLEPGSGRADSADAGFSIRDLGAVIKEPSLSILLAGITIPMSFLMASFLWYLVPLTLASTGSNASSIARTLMVYYLVILAGGPLLERFGSKRMRPRTLVGAGAVLSGAILVIPALEPTALSILLAVLVVGIGHAAIRGPQVALAMDIAEQVLPGAGRDATLAAMRSLERLGSLFGLLLIAVIASIVELRFAIGVVGAITATSGAAFLLAGPMLARRASADA